MLDYIVTRLHLLIITHNPAGGFSFSVITFSDVKFICLKFELCLLKFALNSDFIYMLNFLSVIYILRQGLVSRYHKDRNISIKLESLGRGLDENCRSVAANKPCCYFLLPFIRYLSCLRQVLCASQPVPCRHAGN